MFSITFDTKRSISVVINVRGYMIHNFSAYDISSIVTDKV